MPSIVVSKAPDHATLDHFTFKHFFAQILLLFSGRTTRFSQNLQVNELAVQAEKINALESSLKTERERIRELTQELTIVRSVQRQLNELQTELNVERETGKLLVQFLEDAERKAERVPVLEELLRQRDNRGDH